MNMYQNNQLGFTLIELLVVISIIGLMSTTVLAAVNSARVKADNAARVRTIQEYKKAFDLSYDADGQYPLTLAGAVDTNVCLGNYPDPVNQCNDLAGPLSEDSNVSSAIERFLSSRPIHQTLLISGFLFDGPIYNTRCSAYSPCRSYIRWQLHGNVSNCGFGLPLYNVSDPTMYDTGFISALPGGYTACLLRLQ